MLIRISKKSVYKTFCLMNRIAALLLAGFLHVSAAGYSQGKITLSLKKAPLEKVFAAIETQSGFTVWYDVSLLKNTSPIDIKVQDATVEQALTIACKGQHLEFSITEKMVVIKRKIDEPGNDPPEKIDVKGRVLNEKGEPLEGAAILIEGTSIGTQTDSKGDFELKTDRPNAMLQISFTGYQTQTISASDGEFLRVVLLISTNSLDQVQVIAYGTTTRRLNTGNIATVTSKEIEEQPVSNPLAALAGRVPGLIITQGNGLPGAGFKIQLRGQSSIGTNVNAGLPPNDPLFIIDGVPFAPNNTPISVVQSGTALGLSGRSPLNSLNPGDIESITILKDADATAIYGSRGANGVVLITTKKGAGGKSKIALNVYTGESRIASAPNMMNTKQFVQMREEALKNDGQPVNSITAPDLIIWDTTRYTDFKKMLLQGIAHTTNAQISVSGGSATTTFLMGAGYHRETTVFSNNQPDNRSSLNFNLNHQSADKKFLLNFSTIYSYDNSNLITADLTGSINLAPDLPGLLDSAGNLVWEQGGVKFDNPLAYLQRKYTANTSNLLSNLQLQYTILPGLVIRTSFGYNTLLTDEVATVPANTVNPITNPNPQGSSFFGNNNFKGWIIEPQAEYAAAFGPGKFDFLIGTTWQENQNKSTSISATGYTNDALLSSISSAGKLRGFDNYSDFKYEAFFGRLNYNLWDKYILNISGRRDGSSRFGPGKRFGNFGAAGAGWIFTNEEYLKRNFKALSYGKLRSSYGITGNDQIGDYKYLDSWVSTQYPYGQLPGAHPQQLADSTYSWEINRKFEIGLDVGFWENRLLISASWFNNSSSNELIAYALPTITGFNNIAATNFPAVVRNTGTEFSIQYRNIGSKNFKWTSAITFSAPKNTLVSFPGLATSSYSNILTIGQPLTVQKGLLYTGVDPATGIFTFIDLNKDGVLNSKDYVNIGNLEPKFYGGFSNTFSYRNLQLDIFLDFRKQSGTSYLFPFYSSNPPGSTFFNEPVALLNRWQKVGDQTNIQQFSATPGTVAYNAAAGQYTSSSARIVDASFVRIKTISLSYAITGKWKDKSRLRDARIYVSAQNLFTITGYKGADPETQNPFTLAPLKTLVAGFQLTF